MIILFHIVMINFFFRVSHFNFNDPKEKQTISLIKNNDDGYSALHLACKKNYIDMAKLLIDNFKDRININLKDKEFGYAALNLSCMNNNVDMAKLLIDNFKHKIDINLQAKKIIPLYIGYVVITKILIWLNY